MRTKSFSPREFLRARRPEKFSDSIVEEGLTLDRSMLEYHLDTLASRSQEVKFEHFARRLAEREICPNLLPQTGPTGGGDSKVDSETYPVADDLSLGWYVGVGREAASERWAFAFSAKKKWQEKVRSDIGKIAATRRGYRKAFFVSNQFIRDKARAEMEDELSVKYGLDVRILDRTWILDKVFSNGHEELAIEELDLTTSTRKKVRKGPLDTQRERDLEELEKWIDEALRQQRFGPQLVDDCINAAILSRELEWPRVEIEGRFERAERTAVKYGTQHQRLECAYQRAWTAFWWYEDYEDFARLYGTVEERAKGSRNAYHLERLTNLWFLLRTAVNGNGLDGEEDTFQVQTDTLIKELERLSEEKNRPSTALQCQTLLLEVQLNLKLASQEPIGAILRDLQDVIRQCAGLVGYPLEPQVEILTELGEFLNGVPAYGELFETIVEIASTRKGEISAARMLLKRGVQQLEADRPYDAIRLLGRALRHLYRHESRHDSIHALYSCGCAYERAGLLWAARGTLLIAASLATDELWRYEDVTPLQAACYRRLKWLELQLGRLPQVLAWHEIDSFIRSALVAQGYDESRLSEGDLEFDVILGILLMKTDIWELKRLSTLPDVLEGLGLPTASIALAYALGYEEELQDESFREAWGDEDLHNIFLKLRDRLAFEYLPDRPSLYDKRKVTLSSTILGCQITVESENASPCIELAESALAALESLLSTGIVERVLAREPTLTVAVRKSDFAKRPFEFALQDRAGRPHIDIACSAFDPHSMSLEGQSDIKDRLVELLATVIARILFIENPDKFFEELFRDELALDRSISFTGSFVTVGNVLGYEPKTRISSWSDSQTQEYPLKRFKAWDADDAHTEKQQSLDTGHATFTPGDGEPPPELLDQSRTKHTQIQTVSLIRETLWSEAKWFGTGFLTSPDESSPPILAPVFEDGEAAKQIFAQWRSELGTHDTKERLRIAIIRGIDKANPFSYRVIIGANPEVAWSQADMRYTVFIYRINTMAPTSDQNLERFLDNYEAFGGYFLVPSVARGELSDLEVFWDYYLVKREIHVREAWEIGKHDIDVAAIHKDDDPIIPTGKRNPPVLELLRWKREQLSSSTKWSSR
jgi:hypothetical protein